jgi:hypothetical protein
MKNPKMKNARMNTPRMKHHTARIPATLAVLVLLFFALPAWATSLSVDEYRQQVRDLAEKVESLEAHPENAGQVESAVPDHVTVSTAAGEVTVSYRDLKNDLAVFSKAEADKRAGLLHQVKNYVQALNAEAEAYAKNETAPALARDKLNNILAQREFHNVRGPSAKDVLMSRIYRWLSRILSKLFVRATSRFEWLQILVYVLVAAALILLAVWTIRRLRRPRDELPQREIVPFSPSAKGWRRWLAEARALAQQQDWRNAIHLAYWAGIAFLEEGGTWKPNRARTPREYLHLLGTRASQYQALSALTRKFEVVWYGDRAAGESDFKETLGQLERLGCR